MSGTNQHYIPRAVIRPFRVNIEGYEQHTYVFRKGEAEPGKPKAIKGVGSAKNFYSDDIDTDLDSRIDKYENILSRMRDELLTCPAGGISSAKPAEYLTHLTLRTAHFRDSSSEVFGELLTQFFSIFTDKNTLKQLFVIDEIFPSDNFKKEWQNALNDSPLPQLLPFPLSLFQRIAFAYLRENLSNQSESLSEAISVHLSDVPGIVKDGIVRAQKKALLSSLAPEARIEVLKKFCWSIHDAPHGTFILPDCIAICYKMNTMEAHPLVFEDATETALILAPLSPSRMLIGSKDIDGKQYINSFNENAARCSHAFFISSFKNQDIISLIPVISESASGTMREKAQSSMNSAVSEYFCHNNGKQDNECGNTIQESKADTKLNINVYISTEGNFRKDYNDILQSVLIDIFQYFYATHSLSTLGRISFTEISPEGQGIAENPFFAFVETLCSNDELISNIHAHSDLALQMILNDKVARDQGIRLFLSLLFRIYFRENLYCSKMYLFNTVNGCTSWRNIVLRNTIDGYEEYFSARSSAHISPDISGYCQFSTQVIGDIPQAILDIKDNFFKTNSFEVFCNGAIIFIRNLLQQIASVLGHSDGLAEEDSEHVDMFIQRFAHDGLNSWVVNLWRDFRYLYENYHACPSEEAFRQLSIHSERVFWQFGIFFWDEGNEIKVFVRP